VPGYADAEVKCPDNISDLDTYDLFFSNEHEEEKAKNVWKNWDDARMQRYVEYREHLVKFTVTYTWNLHEGIDTPEGIASVLTKVLLLPHFGSPFEAEMRMRCILILVQNEYGETHELSAVVLFDAALVAQMQGNFDTAEAMLRQGLSILDDSTSTDLPMHIKLLTLRGLGARAVTDDRAAVIYFQRALELIRKLPGFTQEDIEPWQNLISDASLESSQ
jgi:hypothetical protein